MWSLRRIRKLAVIEVKGLRKYSQVYVICKSEDVDLINEVLKRL